MRSTLVVAGAYAGVALAAPSANVQGAEAMRDGIGWPWNKQQAPPTNNKPKNGQGAYPGYSGGFVNAYNPNPWSSKPQTVGSKPSGFGGLFSMFKGNGGSSGSSSSSGFGGGFGGFGGSYAASGSSGRGKGGAAPAAPYNPWAPKPEAAEAPAAPYNPWGLRPEAAAPAAPAAAEAPAAAALPGAVEAADEAAAPEAPVAPAPPKQAPKPAAPKLVPSAPTNQKKTLWQPKVAAPFQIVLSGTIDHSVKLAPEFVEIFDIDLFNTPKSSIQALKKQNKKIICYFSAGSSENWRQDFNRFKAADMGNGVAKDDAGSSYWAGEKWLNTKSQNVRNIMRDRIKLAADKGCDAIDPDNMDVYANPKTGWKTTEADAVDYMKFLALEGAKYNMSTGLKNSMDILPKVQNFIQFAVNEECAAMGECGVYKDFLRTKPVFHIEYTKTKSGGTTIGTDKEYGRGPSSGGMGWLFGGRKNSKRAVDASASQACSFKTAPDLGPKFSTVIKVEDLDGWVKFCDGRTSNTRTVGTSKSRYTVEDSSESKGSAKSGSWGGFGGSGAKEDADDGDD